MSFLNLHFCTMMDAWHDGVLKRANADDIVFNLSGCETEEEVAAIYCIVNDLDNNDVPGLVEMYHEYSKTHQRPIPSNIQLSEN